MKTIFLNKRLKIILSSLFMLVVLFSMLLTSRLFAGNIDLRIPSVYISIDEEEYKNVLASRDHSYRAKGASVRIVLPAGYQSEYGKIDPACIDTELAMEYVQGRGNSTWLPDKRSFKLKLKEGADVLGMGKDKHWVLISNTYDPSFLRSRLVLYLGRAMGLEYTPKLLPADLYINGEYTGSYLFGQDVRLGASGVDIDKMDPTASTEPQITGGYLLAESPYPFEPGENVFQTSRGVRFKTEEPYFATENSVEAVNDPSQKAYIAEYIQKTENAVFGDGITDENGVAYTEYMDLESAAKYWWIQEFIANPDAFRSPSTYLYKKRDGKLYWGPLWDFDMAMNPAMYADTLNNTQMSWLDHLRAYDPSYQEMLRTIWKELEPLLKDMTADGGLLDCYAEEIKESAINDYKRWEISKDPEGCFEAQIIELKQFIDGRRKSINENLDVMLKDVATPDTPVKQPADSDADSQHISFLKDTDLAGGLCGTCRWVIDKDGHMTIAPDDGISGELDEWTSAAERPWSPYVRKVTGVSIEGKVLAKTCLEMFYGCYYLTDIDLSGLDTSNVEVMRRMFAWCYHLEKLDVSVLDTSKAVTTREMFLNCSNLTELDVSGFDLSNVTTTCSMFMNCYKLERITLPEHCSGNISDMSGMFSGCSALTDPGLSSFDTSGAENMRAMFFRCRALATPDLKNFDISHVTDMSYIFAECESMEQSAVSVLDLSNVQETECMFLFCPAK